MFRQRNEHDWLASLGSLDLAPDKGSHAPRMMETLDPSLIHTVLSAVIPSG